MAGDDRAGLTLDPARLGAAGVAERMISATGRTRARNLPFLAMIALELAEQF